MVSLHAAYALEEPEIAGGHIPPGLFSESYTPEIHDRASDSLVQLAMMMRSRQK